MKNKKTNKPIKKSTGKKESLNKPITEKEGIYIFLSSVILILLFANIIVQPSITGYAVNEEVADALSNINFGNLVSDTDFTDYNAASYEQIKNFIESRKPKPFIADPKNVGGVDVAKIITEKAEKYRINPILLLATLQKESALVRSKSASEKLIAKAMGCACPDDPKLGAVCDPSKSGLENQIECGAATLRKWYDKGLEMQFPYTMKGINYGERFLRQKPRCNKGQNFELDVANAATYSLYKYTPHMYDYCLPGKTGGNYIFYKIWIPFYYEITGTLPYLSEPENVYKINPSFKAWADYNLNIFDKTIFQAKSLRETCKNSPKKEECIKKVIEGFNKDYSDSDESAFVWEQECSKGYEKVFHDLAYHLKRAQASTYDLTKAPACYYEFSLSYSQGDVQPTNYEIRMQTLVSNTKLSIIYPAEIYLEETIQDLKIYAIAKNYKFENLNEVLTDDKNKAKPIFDSVFGVRYNNKGNIGGGGIAGTGIGDLGRNDICFAFGTDCTGTGTACSACKDSTKVNLNWDNSEEKVYLYKTGNILAFIPPDKFKSQAYNKLPKCEPPPEIDYAFCVRDIKERKLTAYEPTIEKTDEFEPILRFAISFRDAIPPPKIDSAQAKDKEKAEETLEVSWDKVVDKNNQNILDLHYYEISCNGKVSARQKPTGKDTEMIDLSFCGTEQIQDLTEKGKNILYDLSISAVDLSGNRGESISLKNIDSVDDLAPGLNAEVSSRKNIFYYLIPTKNEDNSDIKPDEPLFLNIYYFTTNSRKPCKTQIKNNINNLVLATTRPLPKLDQLDKEKRNFKLGNEWVESFPYSFIPAAGKNTNYCVVFSIIDESNSFDIKKEDPNSERFNRLLVVSENPIRAELFGSR